MPMLSQSGRRRERCAFRAVLSMRLGQFLRAHNAGPERKVHRQSACQVASCSVAILPEPDQIHAVVSDRIDHIAFHPVELGVKWWWHRKRQLYFAMVWHLPIRRRRGKRYDCAQAWSCRYLWANDNSRPPLYHLWFGETLAEVAYDYNALPWMVLDCHARTMVPKAPLSMAGARC